MVRKRKGTKQPPRVLRHVLENESDGIRFVQGPLEQHSRLAFLWDGPYLYDPEEFARLIRVNPGVVYFCDSTQFIGPTHHAVWDALLADKRIAITPPVFEELKTWLENPKENLRVHQEIVASYDGDENAPIGWVRITKPELASVCEYYGNLLGFRKDMFEFAQAKLEEELGRTPTNEEVSNHCQQVGSPRAQLLGRQGAQAKVAAHKFNDEFLVVTAVLFSIVTGREIAIVTSDEAVLDQFCKLFWLIDTHYRSMLIADRYVANPLEFPTARANNPHKQGFEDERLLLLRKPSASLREVLPRDYTPIELHCFLIQKTFTHVRYFAENGMRRLFDVKARTNGLSSDQLDGRNCHVFLGNMLADKIGNWAAIGFDQHVTTPLGMKIARVDIELALLSSEHHTRLRPVDPDVLLLPPGFDP